MVGDEFAVAQAHDQLPVTHHTANRVGQLEADGVGPARGVEPVRFHVVEPEAGALANQFGDIGNSLIHPANQAGSMAVDGQAQDDGVADVLVLAEGRVEQREHAAHAPAMQ